MPLRSNDKPGAVLFGVAFGLEAEHVAEALGHRLRPWLFCAKGARYKIRALSSFFAVFALVSPLLSNCAGRLNCCKIVALFIVSGLYSVSNLLLSGLKKRTEVPRDVP